MDIIEGPLIVETPQGTQQPGSQPTIVPIAEKQPELDDAAVRQAIAVAEAQGQNPESLTISDLSQGNAQNPPQAAQPQASAAPEVPAKFLKPDGSVDVEKLQTSTRQLDAAVQTKEAAVQKTTADYVREYKALEAKFRNMPNPERLAPPPAPVPVQPVIPQQMSDQQLREILQRDYNQDPIGTTAQLIEIALQKKFEPIEVKMQDERIRGNIEQLAAKDPRILQPEVFAAINAKLAEDPELWKLKQPHKAAWLEVKDEMRLGELPVGVNQAQPRPTSPILGGGTPPSAPSASGVLNPQKMATSLDQLDIRDRKQEAAGDEAIRALLARER